MRFSKPDGSTLRRVCRTLHRDLSFFISGLVVVYAVSGIAMNHRDTINPNYSVDRTEYDIDTSAITRDMDRPDVQRLLEPFGRECDYTKHYFPDERTMKVFIRGGSSLTVDLADGRAVYERLTPRPVLQAFTRLHYNPGRWWTAFADTFAVMLLAVTLTGIVMVRGRKGLWGRGGVELAVGAAIPILFLLI